MHITVPVSAWLNRLPSPRSITSGKHHYPQRRGPQPPACAATTPNVAWRWAIWTWYSGQIHELRERRLGVLRRLRALALRAPF